MHKLRPNGTRIEIKQETRIERNWTKDGKEVIITRRFRVVNADAWIELLSDQANEYYVESARKYQDALQALWD